MGVQERRMREKMERRRQILEAAHQLIVERGLDSISINLIAKEAEIGVGTIYFHFKNKDEILAAIQAEGLSVLYQKVNAVANEETGVIEKLKAVAFTYLAFSEEEKSYFDIINYFLSAPEVIFTPELKSRIDEEGFRTIGVISELIEEGVRQGQLAETIPDKSAIAYWGSVHGWVLLKKMKHTILQGQSHRDFYAFAVEEYIHNIQRK